MNPETTNGVTYNNEGFTVPPVVLDKGVAAIDLITLGIAADKVVDLGFPITLPEFCESSCPEVFNRMAMVTVNQGISGTEIKAVIDTKKMTWALLSGAPEAKEFTDYRGERRYGVQFTDHTVCKVNSVYVVQIPVSLGGGDELFLWVASLSESDLEGMSQYDLYGCARALTAGLERDVRDKVYDFMLIPAQQIDYKRSMSEIVAMNEGTITAAEQGVRMALDETGVRVDSYSRIACAGIPVSKPPETFVFGAAGPVLMWMTERTKTVDQWVAYTSGDDPFAVVLTTSEAWLEPGSCVSFS
jgi:hypothetical protein